MITVAKISNNIHRDRKSLAMIPNITKILNIMFGY